MHFPIIEINSEKYKDEHFSIYDDSTLQYYTDYYGEEYNSEERMRLLESEWFNEMFNGIGKVIPEKGIIQIFDEDTVRKTLNDYFSDVLEELEHHKEDDRIWEKFFAIRNAGTEYKHCSALFFYNGCGFTSMQFMEDVIYNAGKELYIGDIFDAHY